LGAKSGVLQQDANKNFKNVFHAGTPNFTPGGNGLWRSGVTSPYLSWLDETQTLTKIEVRPFNTGDGGITVEWLSEEERWVDFNYNGVEVGTFDSPFNTLAEGVSAVPYDGTLKIKAGSRNEAATIAKRMRIEAYGGTVTIGQ